MFLPVLRLFQEFQQDSKQPRGWALTFFQGNLKYGYGLLLCAWFMAKGGSKFAASFNCEVPAVSCCVVGARILKYGL